MTAFLPLCRPGNTRIRGDGIEALPVARWMLLGIHKLMGSIWRTRLVSVAAQSAAKGRLSLSSLS